jgi:L-alanine-DL-glutamate epimerase-like enolase superfamily enzyme
VAVLGDRVAAVRDAVGPSVELRVDFNGSLEAATAAATLETLATHRLEYAEQPIAPTAGAAALARLRRDTAVPIAADEAVRDLGTARELVELQAVDALVVKPARVGGLRQAYALVELATAAGVSVTLSTLFESGVGLAGALHLAAATPGGQAHGLATAELLESDLLEAALPISAGRMAVPRGPGIGVALDADAVERYRVE